MQMYTCRLCGKPTPNFHPYETNIARILHIDGESICDECYDALARRRHWKNEQFKTENIVCPWCGYENKDSWELPNEDDEYECPECGRVFEYQRNFEVTYTSCRRIDDYPDEDGVLDD